MKSPYTDSLAHTTYECKYHIVFAPQNICRFVKHMSHFLDTTNLEIPIMLLLNFHFLYILHIYRLDSSILMDSLGNYYNLLYNI